MTTTSIFPLFEPQQLPAAASPLFTAETVTRIDKLTVTNTDVAVRAVTFYWVPVGQGFSTANAIVSARLLQVGETWDVIPAMGHVLGAGDALYAMADAANVVNVFASGLTVA